MPGPQSPSQYSVDCSCTPHSEDTTGGLADSETVLHEFHLFHLFHLEVAQAATIVPERAPSVVPDPLERSAPGRDSSPVR